MINYMLMRDAKQFSLIYLIFLCSFAQSMFFTNYKEDSISKTVAGRHATSSSQEASELGLLADWLASILAQYAQLWLELFKMTLGVYEFQPFRHSLLSRGLLMLFIHLIPILFNM